MSSVWALSMGEYSDYQVCALFTKKEDAEAILTDLGENPGYYLEEFTIYEDRKPVIPRLSRAAGTTTTRPCKETVTTRITARARCWSWCRVTTTNACASRSRSDSRVRRCSSTGSGSSGAGRETPHPRETLGPRRAR